MHYIQALVDEEVDVIHIFCNNCRGQNKNHVFVRAMMSLVELKVIKSVKVFFSELGHSFLQCDRAFRLIQQKLKKSDRLYTIDEYVNIISSSSDNPNKFKIVLVDSIMILDFQNWYQTNALQSHVGLLQRPKFFQFLVTIILSVV